MTHRAVGNRLQHQALCWQRLGNERAYLVPLIRCMRLSVNVPVTLLCRGFSSSVRSKAMANSRFEYVKKFEQDDQILLHCWIVIRLDGKGFTRYSYSPI